MALEDALAKAIAKVLADQGIDSGDPVKVDELKKRYDTTDTLEALEKEQKAIKDLMAEGQNLFDGEERLLQLRREIAKQNNEYTRERIQQFDAEEAGLKAGRDAALRYLGVSQQQNAILSQLAAGGKEYFDGLKTGFSAAISKGTTFLSTLDKVYTSSIALATAQDQAAVSLAKTTGQGAEFNATFREVEETMFMFGITNAEAAAATGALFSNVTDFTEMAEKQQVTLAKNVAILAELGVAAETSSQNIQFSMKVLGMSVDQSTRLQRELITFAQDLGVASQQIASDFATMAPTIAALGTDGVDAFRRLQVQAKNTGLQLEEILGIVDQFNKFDTAAQSVGRLNALLGGPYLNTLELVAETDPSKRFEILKNRIDAAGVSFDQLDFFQRKALASAIGLNEQQLALLMRGRIDLIQEPQKSAAELEELAAQTAQFNTMAEEMGQIMRSFAISFGPVVSGLKDLVQFFQPILPLMVGLGVIALGVAAPLGAISTTIGVLVGGLILLTSAFKALTHGLQFGFSMTPAATLGMTADAIDAVSASMDNMPSAKTIDVMSNIAHSVDAAGTAAVTRSATATTSAAQAPASSGPLPPINIHLEIDGEQFATHVRRVEPADKVGQDAMYNAILGMIHKNFTVG